MRKLLFALSVAIILASLLCITTAVAASNGTCGDNVNWSLSDDGLLTISGSGRMKDYSAGEARPWGNNITKLVIEEGVTSIGNYAFCHYSNLTSIEIADSVLSIGNSSFYNSFGYDRVVISKNIKSIGDFAFSNSGLKELVILDGLMSFDPRSFFACNLTSITVSNANEYLSSIDGVLFDKNVHTLIMCPQAREGEYSIPNGVTCVGKNAFCECTALTRILTPDSLTEIGDYAFDDCYSMTSITILEGLEKIGIAAFRNCNGLTSITLPSSVKNIAISNLFAYCNNLSRIEVNELNPYYCSINGVMFNKSLDTILLCPPGKTGNYRIPDDVSKIYNGAFLHNNLDNISIPNSVYYIGSEAFRGSKRLVTIEIPDTVTYIDDVAFCESGNLQSISIPQGITFIGDSSFMYCSNLKNITIPNSVTNIKKYAFYRCTNLKDIWFTGTEGQWNNITKGEYWNYKLPESLTIHFIEGTDVNIVDSGTCGTYLTWTLDITGLLTISGTGEMYDYEYGFSTPWYKYRESIQTATITEGVTSIGKNAFSWCSNLETITIPAGIISIAENAFYDCNFESITIPASTNNIAKNAFGSCNNLENIQVDNENQVYSSNAGVLYNKQRTKLICCPEGKKGTLTIPEGVNEIDLRDFSSCTKLTSLSIPASVTSIETFGTVGYYSNITVASNSTEYSSIDGILYNKEGTELLYCPRAKQGTVTAVNGVISIGDYAFNLCNDLDKVVIPYGATTIGYRAFSCCEKLSTVIIPDSVTNIGAAAFYWSNLTEIIIPSGVTRIDDETFMWCGELASITIPASVTEIGVQAFLWDSSLTSITLPPNLTYIDESAFCGCNGLTSISIPASVTHIGENVFSGCGNLTSIVVENGNNNYASQNGVLYNKDFTTIVQCPAGKAGSFTVPNTVTKIGNNAFSACQLTNIVIPDTVTLIEHDAFSSSQLTSIVIPEGITNIDEHVLGWCADLRRITIPNSVTSIGDGAFYQCNNLFDIYFEGTEEKWEQIQYNLGSVSDGTDNSALVRAVKHFEVPTLKNILTLPESLTVIESQAFTGLPNVDAIRIPATVTSISPDAFDDTVILLMPNETWGQWATSNGYSWR